MIEIRIPISEGTTVGDLRAFLALANSVPANMPVASYDEHDDLWGLAIVVDPSALQPMEH